ncbi:MAG: hypothetical protein L3J23_00395 [Flavobacteriaceae bacterium]|nr:hypothetical protein [Flavobacteriaceae bacterium]
MYKFLFKRLLLANYCASRWLVNKKMPERVIPSTLYFFITPFTFIAAGIYFVIIGSIDLSLKVIPLYLLGYVWLCLVM